MTAICGDRGTRGIIIHVREWLDKLVREMDDQKDAVNNAIEELGDRTEVLMIQKEEKEDRDGASALVGFQVASKPA